MGHIDDLLERLDLEERQPDVFLGEHPATSHQRVFGGQVMAQALAALYRTVDPDRLVHSLKGYFVRAGSTATPIQYRVSRTRDGGSFSTRRVLASQNGQDIFAMSASLKKAEKGFEHYAHVEETPPAPEDCPPLVEVLGQASPEAAKAWDLEWSSLETRFAGSQLKDSSRGPRMGVWLRSETKLPDDPRVHQMILAYASDLTLLAVSTLPHPQAFGSDQLQVATIDHTMWFHRPLRADEWVFYDQASPNASNALGLSFGKLYDEHGVLGAHAAQEGLVRIVDGRPRHGLV